ncbi:MAG: peptide chain release factor 1 [Longimicrobiales bacterium]
MISQERVRDILQRRDELNLRLSDPAVIADPAKLRQAAQEHAELSAAAEVAGRLEQVRGQLADAHEIMAGSRDAELLELARAEVEALAAEEAELSERLRRLLVPKDPLADRAAVVEIRAGTGGDEAALFAGDLFRMYRRYADARRWAIELVHASESEGGGMKEVVFVVRGQNAYGDLRNESGVHRVQRVPATESQGRIHTSAATVAVLPEAEEVDIQVRDDELRIDVFRSSGPGGQSVNTTDSAVRVTHLPSGLVVSCQDEKSQHKNKSKALKVLRSRLLDLKLAEQESARARERRTQVGTGDRSAKIRTYNFPQGRVTDHRIGLTLHRLEEVLDGELDELVQALKDAREAERMESAAIA